MTPPTVLLDATFVGALTDTDHDAHDAATECYLNLLGQFERREVRLRARTDVLGPGGSDLLAPVERIHIAGQHRRAAARLHLPVPVDPDVALTLVLMRREGIRRIASLDPAFRAFDLTVLPTV